MRPDSLEHRRVCAHKPIRTAPTRTLSARAGLTMTPMTSTRLGSPCGQNGGGYGPSLPAASSARDPLNMLNIP